MQKEGGFDYDMCEVVAMRPIMESNARKVREKDASDAMDGRRTTLSKTSLGYFRNVFCSGTRPLSLLNQILPECLGTKEIQTSSGDLELKRSSVSTNTFWLQRQETW